MHPNRSRERKQELWTTFHLTIHENLSNNNSSKPNGNLHNTTTREGLSNNPNGKPRHILCSHNTLNIQDRYL